MSPVSRGRKAKKTKKAKNRQRKNDTSARRLGNLSLVGDQCDCPECSADRAAADQPADFDPDVLIDELLAAAATLHEDDDPLSAEMLGATFVAGGTGADEFEQTLAEGFVPAFEVRAGAEALAMLLAIGSVAEGRGRKAALSAADRLVKAGIKPPSWAAELDEPITVDDCRRVADSGGAVSILMCSFHRAGRSHSVVMTVNHLDCGAASGMTMVGPSDLPHATKAMVDSGLEHGVEVTDEAIDAAELRWQFDNALEARAVHDRQDLGLEGADTADDESDSEYPALAVLLRSRLTALPKPSRPKAPHADRLDHSGSSPAELLGQLLRNAPGPFGTPAAELPAAELPPKRKQSDGAAPRYQVKIGLQGAKPPIWRRLEMPADISLARLHTVIQVAFGWHDDHLHSFDTPYGRFGQADPGLGQRSETGVTLEQVAPDIKNRFRYTYDFGDDWEHDVAVEKILDPDDTAPALRCTGGRRAAPPEDCGGIWGYAELVEAVADPNHPEHDDMLEWLGLDGPSAFDPAAFEATAVTEELSRIR